MSTRDEEGAAVAQAIHIRSWQAFQTALADTLIGMEAWRSLTVRERERPGSRVRFTMHDDRLRAETPGDRLEAADRAALLAAGWEGSERGSLSAEAAWPAPCAEYRRLSGMAVALFQGALRLETPQALEMVEGREPTRAREGDVALPPGGGEDLGPRRLEQTVEYLFATRPDEAEQHEELFAKSLQSNDLGLRQVAAGDRMAVLAAEDAARAAGATVVPDEGCVTQPGMRHVVAVARGRDRRPTRMLVAEAVGPDCDMGSRLVDEARREWAPRGSPAYLRWMLEHDDHVRRLLESDRQLADGLRSGAVALEYVVSRVDAQGRVATSPVPLDALGAGSLRLGGEEPA